MNAREITYYDVSPFAASSATVQKNLNEIQAFSQPEKLFEKDIVYKKIQTCEHNYTVLDGTHIEFSDGENIALWSKTLSANSTRLLSQSVTLDISFGGLQNSPGLTLTFDEQSNTWCDTVNIKWLGNNNTLLSEKNFYPDSPVYSCINRVDLYNRVQIKFTRMNLPYRYLRLESVMMGIVRVFTDGELENLTINEGFDPTNRTMFINSANFTINTKDIVPYMFMKRQPLHIKYGEKYMGAYYIDRSQRFADRRFTVEAVDKIGVLDASDDFMGGIYNNNISAETLVKNIVDGMFDVEVASGLKNINISGWLPVMKRRDALAQVALAIGAFVDTTRSDIIAVKALPAGGSVSLINKNRVYQSSSVDTEFPFTGIELIEHNFTAGTSSKELYSDTFSGQKTVIFSEPASNFTIENGTVISSGANYAVITSAGSAVCTLRGRVYIDNKNSVTVKNSNVIEGTREKTEKIENCWLVNKSNSQAVAQRLYNYYLRQNLWDGDFLVNPSQFERIGEKVKIATVFETDGGYITGQTEKLTLNLGSKNIKARGIIRSD